MTRAEALDDLRALLDLVRLRMKQGRDSAALDDLVDAVALLADIVEAVAGPEK